MSYNQQRRRGFDQDKLDSAEDGGSAFTRAEEQIELWLRKQAENDGLRVGEVSWPIPLYPAWRKLSGNIRSPLPPPEVIFSNLRRRYPGVEDERLLRVALGRVVNRIDPPADLAYVRAHVDPNKTLPDVRLRPMRQPDLPSSDDSVPFSYLVTIGDKPKGKAVMSFSAGAVEREAWFSSLQFVRGATDVPNYTATYIAGSERAHRDGYTFRTPPDRALGPMAVAAWQQFIESGVSRVVAPLQPAHADAEMFIGHVCVAPRAQRVG